MSKISINHTVLFTQNTPKATYMTLNYDNITK